MIWCVCGVFEFVVYLNVVAFGALLVLCGGCSGQAAIEPHTNTERRAHTTLVGLSVCLLNMCVVCLTCLCCEAVASVQNKRSRQTICDNPPSTMYEKNRLAEAHQVKPASGKPRAHHNSANPPQVRSPWQATGFIVYLQSSLK